MVAKSLAIVVGALLLVGCHPWPDASNTGPPAATRFTAHSGDMFTTTAGQVIDAVHVRDGTIVCDHANVTIRNSKTTGPHGGISALPGCTGLRVDNVEIDCANRVGTSGFSQSSGFVGQNIELRRLNIHHCENGVVIDNGVGLHDSWIHHGVPYDPVTDPHTDGVQLWASASDVVVEGNVVDMSNTPTNAAFTSNCDTGLNADVHDVEVHHNMFLGGGYSVYLPSQHGNGECTYTNVRFTDNRIDDWAFGPCTGVVGDMSQWSGNVDDSSSAAIASC